MMLTDSRSSRIDGKFLVPADTVNIFNGIRISFGEGWMSLRNRFGRRLILPFLSFLYIRLPEDFGPGEGD